MSLRSRLMVRLMHRFAKAGTVKTSKDPEATRAALDAANKRMPKPPAHARFTHGHLGGVPVVWSDVATSSPDRILLYMHGGAYTAGSPESHYNLLWRLAKGSGCRVVAVDYRLAPEHPYPAPPVNDCLAAYRAIRAENPDASVAIAGDSAGGGLTFAMLAELGAGDDEMPSSVVGMSAWADLSCSTASWTENDPRDPWLSREGLEACADFYRGDKPLDHPGASPVFADYARVPPTLLQVGETEVLRDDSRLLADRLAAGGGYVETEIWHDVPHVWQMFAPMLPESGRAIDGLCGFMNRYW